MSQFSCRFACLSTSRLSNQTPELLTYITAADSMGLRSLVFTQLLPRDASAERGDATVSRLSVCLSVCQALHIFHTVSSGVAYDLRAPGYI